MVPAPVAELPAPRREILIRLRKRGEATADELAAELVVTVGAVRQQLRVLGAGGLVEHRDERSGPGRPRRRYRLGPGAEALFPKSYGELASELLGYVDDEDPALLKRAFERRRQVRVAHARDRLAGLTFEARVAELARILDEAGYLADFRPLPGGGFEITEHNCAILSVAQRHAHACSTEISFLREVMPDADIRRVAHLLTGSTACVYRIAPGGRRARPSDDVGPSATPPRRAAPKRSY